MEYAPFQSSSIAMLINTINTHEINLHEYKSIIKTQQLLKNSYKRLFLQNWVDIAIQLVWRIGSNGTKRKHFQAPQQSGNQPTLEKKNTLVLRMQNKLSEPNINKEVCQDISKKIE